MEFFLNTVSTELTHALFIGQPFRTPRFNANEATSDRNLLKNDPRPIMNIYITNHVHYKTFFGTTLEMKYHLQRHKPPKIKF